MRTFLATDANDFARGSDGNLNLIVGDGAILQTGRQYMQTRRGEMIHDIQSGIPFDTVVWASSANIAQFEAAGRARLLQVPDVLEVVSFVARQDGDVLGYTATIRTTTGETVING